VDEILAMGLLSLLGVFIFLLEIGVTLFLLLTLRVRWRETKIPVLTILIGLYILFIAFVGFEFIFYLLNINDPVKFYLEEGTLITSLFPFYGGISSGVFMLFIEFFRKDRVSPIHASIYGLFLGGFVLNVLYQILFIDYLPTDFKIIQNDINLLSVILVAAFFLYSTNFPAAYFVGYVIVVTVFSLQKIKAKIKYTRQKSQLLMLQLSIIAFYFVPLILVVSARFLENNVNSELLVFLRHLAPHISVIIGSALIYRAYAKAPAGLLQFHNLSKLMVINKSGLLLYSHDFIPEGEPTNKGPDRDVLFSGGVLAVLNLFTEMIETTNIKLIQFQEQIIMLSNNENFITFIIADHTSRFLWSAIDSFSRFFNLKYGSDAEELTVVPKHVFEGALELVNLAFGR
jgi:hypothetical protein